MAIYLEPSLPRPDLVVIGQSPMARSLAVLGDKLGFRVTACDPSATAELFPDAESLVQQLDDIRGMTGPRSYVVVATAGHYDEEALEAALSGEAGYVGLVASPRRGRAVIDYLRGKGVCPEALKRVKYPAGVDIGAETPEEIALSILTEIVQRMRANPAGISLTPAAESADAESIDPICNMTVKVAASPFPDHNRSIFAHWGARTSSSRNPKSGRVPVRFQPQRECFPFLLTGVQRQVRAGTRTLRASAGHVVVSGAVVLHGQHLGQNGHGKLGRGSRPYIQANGSPDTGQVGVAEA